MKTSAATSYKSIVTCHLRPAFGTCRSVELTSVVVDNWRRQAAKRIAAGTMSRKTYQNVRMLLGAILDWARHQSPAYLEHDPLDGLPPLPKLSRARRRPHLEPEQVARVLKFTRPPDDTIIMTDALSGLRRGEVFALQWPDIDPGNGRDGGVLHIRRSVYHGVVTTPKTDGSERTLDVPQRLLDELEIHRLTYPSIGAGYIFRTSDGRPLDPDNWYHRHLVPALKRAGVYAKGMGQTRGRRSSQAGRERAAE